MAGSQRLRCKTCRKQFTRLQGSNRLNCYECRPQRLKEPETVVPVDFTSPAGEAEASSMTARTRAKLDKEGVADTWQAMACIKLAELIDSGKHGASGPAGTIRAHREAMVIALAEGGKKASVLGFVYGEQA